MGSEPIFHSYEFTAADREQLDQDGHFLLPGLLTAQACEKLIGSLSHIQSLVQQGVTDPHPNRNAAEYDSYLESLIAHPQMLALARQVLGEDIRFDHCVSLNRAGGMPSMNWHSHAYAEDDTRLGFVRIFFYVNGFDVDDGSLKVVPGSHLYRDIHIHAETDEELEQGWIESKQHPIIGNPLEIQHLSAPPGTVILMWTHAAHGVNARKAGSDTRWTVVYAYRNPGKPSGARWITDEFERKPIPGAEGLMSLY